MTSSMSVCELLAKSDRRTHSSSTGMFVGGGTQIYLSLWGVGRTNVYHHSRLKPDGCPDLLTSSRPPPSPRISIGCDAIKQPHPFTPHSSSVCFLVYFPGRISVSIRIAEIVNAIIESVEEQICIY